MILPRCQGQAREALAAIVKLAVGYDRDGVDIRFFTKMDHTGDKMASSIQCHGTFSMKCARMELPTRRCNAGGTG